MGIKLQHSRCNSHAATYQRHDAARVRAWRQHPTHLMLITQQCNRQAQDSKKYRQLNDHANRRIENKIRK